MSSSNNYKELFTQESIEIINHLNENLLELEKNTDEQELIHAIFRDAHTLKGMAATMGFFNIQEMCQGIEEVFEDIRQGNSKISISIASILFQCFDILQELIFDTEKEINIKDILLELKEKHEANHLSDTVTKPNDGDNLIEQIIKNHNIIDEKSILESDDKAKQSSLSNMDKVSTIRVKMNDLETLVNLTGELMITKMRLEQSLPKNGADESRQIIVTLSRLIADLQSQTMKVRLVPTDQIFNRYPRIVRDLATKLNKQVSVEIDTSGIELDRSVLDAISEPLIHIIRNSVDHGIETVEERINNDKPATGTIKLIALRVGDKVQIKVEDDGKGIDLNQVVTKAIEKKFITESQARAMTDEEIVKLIGTPGLSTAETITDISGRGVGMDVVFNKVESVGGQVNVKTEKGKGTIISILLPMTMSIIGGLVVTINNEKYVLPLSTITSTLRVSREEIQTANGLIVMMFRGKVIPVVQIADILDVKLDKTLDQLKKVTIVVVNNGTKSIGIIVDSFERNQEFVIKRVDNMQNFTNAFTNTTILSDGRPALIIDPAILV